MIDAPTRIEHTAETILQTIIFSIAEKGFCTLMLTGGKTVMPLYRFWAGRSDFPYRQITFFFGDERCVPVDHPSSNYGQAMKALFPAGIPVDVKIHRMEADAPNLDESARQYEALLPEKIDVLMLSMGEDGHIASLFPNSPALLETRRQVMPVIGTMPSPQRLTITPIVIQNARQVFVMAIGKQKRAMYEAALRDPSDIDTIPARLVLDRTWIFETD